jgi:putative endopeptidase
VKPILVLFMSAMSILLYSCATNQPTSEIPERREFPINPEINACNDFFQHACSKAIEGFKLREDRNRHIFAFNDSSERLLDIKKDYLSELLNKKEFNDKTQQLHDYHASCLNRNARKAEEIALLKKKAEKIKSIKTKKEFVEYLVQKALKGQEAHVGYGNIPNLDNSDIYDFIIMPSRMTSLPEKSYYENPELMTEFKGIISDFFKLAGWDQPDQRAQWVAAYETKYIKNYPTPAERRPLWSKRAYSSKKDLLKFTHLQLGPILDKVPGNIKIRNPMNEVFGFLNKAINETDLEQLKSAFLFQSMEGHLDEGFPDYFKKRFAFNAKHLGGSPQRPSLEERCTMDTMEHFSKEMDSQLFDRVFPDFPEEKFVGLLEKVRASIIEGLVRNTWLTQTAKANAIKKIKGATFQVVKPKTESEWNFNPPAKYSPQHYIQNKKTLAKNLNEREFERLPKPVDKDIWWMSPLTVNAYYSPPSNKFVMPAGILQYPFYDPKLPDWVNLGAVGAVVGHELGHGVDDQGSKYDEKGKVRQWMTEKDLVNFRKRGESLIAQFQAAGHDGKLTLGENIGDLVGVTFALNAAQKLMPVDPVARDQATRDFFLQYARAWCGVIRPKRAEMQLKTDPHALVWARVNEQMKHQGEFARVYQCKQGDKLYLAPEKRVTIW